MVKRKELKKGNHDDNEKGQGKEEINSKWRGNKHNKRKVKGTSIMEVMPSYAWVTPGAVPTMRCACAWNKFDFCV